MSMGIVALVLRMVLAAMFAVAGIAKFRSIQKTKQTVKDFGLPVWAAGPVSLLLPAGELGVALLLVPVSTVLWASLASLGLLSAFSILIVINLLQGRTPQCNCFGQMSSKPIGWPTLWRNGAMGAVASLVCWNSIASRPLGATKALQDQLSGAKLSTVAAALCGAAITVAGAYFALHLLRQNGRILLRLDALEQQHAGGGVLPRPADMFSGLPIGEQAPAFTLPSLSGELVSLDQLQSASKNMVLIFTDPDCGPCTTMLPDLSQWEKKQHDTTTLVLIGRGEKLANQTKLREHPLKNVLLQNANEVATAYQVKGTPGAVLIDRKGLIASEVVLGAQSIGNLIRTSEREAPALHNENQVVPSQGLEIGSVAPSVTFPDSKGGAIKLGGAESSETLLLFWNPSCGYCTKMLPALRAWEAERSNRDPQLLVISSGTIAKNGDLGITSPTVIDPNFSYGAAYQVRGTPSAVLVDRKGAIASKLAIGADAIFHLVRSSHS